jgi:hypothetical protein
VKKLYTAIRYISFLSLNSSRLGISVDEKFKGHIHNYIIIVDEAHNLFKMIVGGSESANKIYKLLLEATGTKLVFMTGTPLVNRPFELVPCVNLLKGKEILVNDKDTFMSSYFTEDNILSITNEM